MRIAYLVLAGLLGACAGSFLNVVAYRLPRGESLVRPGSRCTSCSAAIAPYDNIPVLAWIWLRGRCRRCGERFSVRYPLVEAATAALCVGVVVVHNTAVDISLGEILVLVLVPVALIDAEHRIVPNRITLPAAVVGLVVGTVLDPGGEVERLIAAAAAGGLLLAALIAYPGGMGMGDVKLAAVMGLFLGRAVAAAMFIALLAGLLAGLVIAARVGVRSARKTAVPFGPFLALGGVAAVFAGNEIVQAYLDAST